MIKILSLLFLILVVRAAFSLYRLLGTIKKTADQMKDQLNGQYSQCGEGFDDRETVFDRRDPQQARQKIIPRDEGEYVDFEED